MANVVGLVWRKPRQLLRLKGQDEGEQKLEIAGSFTVNLNDYGISVPSVPFMSAGNTGTVEVDLLLTK